MTAILKSGDVVHMQLPSFGNPEDDERFTSQLRDAYAAKGVNLWIATHAPDADVRVVTIFREDT